MAPWYDSVAMQKHLFLFVTFGWAVACGGAQPQPASPTTTSAHVEPKAAEPKAEPVAAPVAEAPPAAEAEAPAAPAPEPMKAVVAEPCDGSWVCVSISSKSKIDRRLTQLIGDPAIETTQSAMIDDARGPAKLEIDGKSYEFSLRRVPGAGAQIVMRGQGPELVLDKHKATDFTYVGIIATKATDGSVLVDIRYMK